MNRSACAARGAVGALFAIGAAGTLGCAGRGVPSAGHEGLHNQSLELEVAVTDDLEQFRTRSTFRYEVVGHGADIYFAVPGVDDLASLEVILDGNLVEPTDLYRTPHPVYSDGDVVRLPATAGADRQGSHELVVSTPWLDPPESSFARWGSWHPFLGDRADPVPIELTVEVPAKLRVVASGRRTAEDVREGIRRSRWRTRNPQGWVFLAVGRYTDRTFTEDGVHVQVWTPAEHEAFESVDPGVLAIEPFRVLRFLEGKLGPSGIDTVRLVFSEPSLPNFSIDGLVAGSSATAARVTTSPEYLRGFLAHELAHYWFGDLVRSRGPGARWMTEGFAEYWRSRYEEAVGADPLPWSYRNQVLLTTFDGPEMPALTDRAQGEAEALYYQKGAYVLYMLERLLGHLALDATMRRFIDRHRGSVVGFQAFFEVAEDVSDTDLAWFVRQWLGRPRGPVFADPVVRFTGDPGAYRVTVEVRQAEPAYRVDVPILIRTTDGVEHRSIRRVDQLHQAFVYDLAAAPEEVTLDPESTILKWFPPERRSTDFATIRAELLAGTPYRLLGGEESPDWGPVRQWMTDEFGGSVSQADLASESAAYHVVLLAEEATRARLRLAPNLPDPAAGTVQVFVRRDPAALGRPVIGIEGDVPDALPPLIPEAPLGFIVFRDGNVVSAHATGLPELTWRSPEARGAGPDGAP